MIQNIESLPVGEPLEKPLHEKRKRTWSRIVECGGSSAASTSPRKQRPRAPQTTDDQIPYINYGSEPDSDESDDEDAAAPVALIPRRFRIAMETPVDDVFPEPGRPTTSTEASSTEPLTEHGPSSFFDFAWTPFPHPQIPPELRRERFSNSNVGPTTPCVDPYETFIAIWDRQFMEYIASETNRYAQEVAEQMFDSHCLHPSNRIGQWLDTSVDELYVYLAMVLAMGMVVKSRIEEYWSASPDIFATPGFSVHMSLKRFQLLSKCLHFNSNRDMCALDLEASDAKLYKIQPVLSHLNDKFQRMYTMRQNIALDESLLQWKGWLENNQFIPNKAASVGIKTYEICESQTGYLWRFEVHAHKSSVTQHAPGPLDGFTPTIVLRLIKGLENKGYTLWMDNFYNSPALARRLKSIGFDCVGTLRTNRKFVPEALSSLTKGSMRPGDIIGFTAGDVDLMVWRDQNCVATISTYHGNAIARVNDATKPILIFEYNIMMGGVDKKDQMLAMYPLERERTKVWYKKLFLRLLNVSVLNAFILVKQSSSSSSATASHFTHRSFRLSLIKSLLSKHSSLSFVSPTPKRPGIFEVKRHHLAEYPFLPGRNSRQRRLCHMCKKRVQTYCVGCEKAVCLSPCFISLHP